MAGFSGPFRQPAFSAGGRPMNHITVIYINRNRDTERIRRSLDSLQAQTDRRFDVLFVDYGSDQPQARAAESLVRRYPFCRYVYNDTRGMPWNRAHALNTGIRLCETEWVFTADIDLVFRNDFIALLQAQADRPRAVFFRVYYLPEGYSRWDKLADEKFPRSEDHALGLALLPVRALNRLRGYDEFYCYWGLEDNDLQTRLRLDGLAAGFYDDDVLLYHQHHPPAVASPGTFPTGWGAFQLAYMNDRAGEAVRNRSYDWGVLHEADSRTAWNLLQKPTAPPVALDCGPLYFQYALARLLRKAGPGRPVSAVFTDARSADYARARLARAAHLLQRGAERLNIPLAVETKYRHLYQTVFEARDRLVLFILANRPLIGDFAFAVEGRTLRFVIEKSGPAGAPDA
jgi:glycosyltransferase involved in cell wall biosynthesis